MRTREPKFSWGGDLIAWRKNYIENWLKENHPSLSCAFYPERGGYTILIGLHERFSLDHLSVFVLLEPSDVDAKIVGKAAVMGGVGTFTAPVMCKRIEKNLMRTGNYDVLCFLDAIMKRIGE